MIRWSTVRVCNFPDLGNGRVREFTHLTDIMIWWSLGIHSEISRKTFHGRVQVFADLTHVMIRWSPGISTVKFDLSKSIYISMDLRRDRKHSLKFRGMLKAQGYAHASPGCRRERSPVKEKCTVVLTGLYPGRGEVSPY